MKKLMATMLTILICKTAFGLPVGNPSDASLLYDGLIFEGYCPDPCDPSSSWCEAISFRFGFYGDYVFNRHLEVDGGADKDIEDTEIYTNAGFMAFNLYDRLDVFVTLGATNLFIDTNASNFFAAASSSRFQLETETAFSWSIGLRGTIWEFGCTSFGAEGQYFCTHPDITRVTFASTDSIYPNNARLKYREWQVGLGISHRINILVPYIAVKWAGAHADIDNGFFLFPSAPAATIVLDKVRSKKLWGYAVGVSLVDCEKASLTVEGRWGDEKAVYVNGQIRL